MAAVTGGLDSHHLAVLSLVGIDPGRIRAVHGGPDANGLVVLGEDRVVKVAAAAPLDPQREMRIWRTVRELGIPAPEPIDAGSRWVAYRLITGSTADLGPSGLRTAGAYLAVLHSSDPAPFAGEPVVRPRRRRRFTLASEFGRRMQGSRWPTELADLVRAAAADGRDVRAVPNHGDFRSANLLGSAGALTGIVDWSESSRGSRERDLGSIDAAALPDVLAGYRETGGTCEPSLVLGHLAARYAALCLTGVLALDTAMSAVAAATDELLLTGDVA